MIEIYEYLIKNNLDVAFIQESNLKPGDGLRGHSKFQIFRLDRDDGRRGGGVITLLKRGIVFRHLSIPPTKVIEALGLEVKLGNQYIPLINIYNPPDCGIADFRHDIGVLTNYISSLLIVGDFNARHTFWGCLRANSIGNSLYDFMQSHNLLIHFPPTSSYIPEDATKRPSTLDFALTNGMIQISDLRVDDEFNISDHRPVHFTIGDEPETFDPTTTYKDYKRADWAVFKEYLNTNVSIPMNGIDAFTDETQINSSVHFLTEVILDAERVAIPEKQRKFDDVNADFHLSRLYGERRALKRRYNRTHNQSLKQDIQLLSDQITRREQELINQRFQRAVDKIENDDPAHKKLFKMSKCLKRRSGQTPPLKVDGKRIIDNTEKADALAKVIADSHSLTHSPIPRNRFEREVFRESASLDQQPPELNPEDLISIRSLRRAIRLLKGGKAPGLDKISNTLIKHLPNKVIVYIIHLFNACLKVGYFPKNWKIAKITCLKKPNKNPEDPKNYRPISLLSALGKLFERLILDRLQCHVDDNDIINKVQFGFRRGHSCVHQAVRLTKLVKRSWRRKRSTAVVTLDIERAFDTVWHKGLIYKLINIGTPQNLCKIIKSFLEDREFSVYVGSSKTQTHKIVAGVPQGSLLSPLLYSIYTTDIPTPAKCVLCQYADDTAMAVTGLKALTMTKTMNAGLRSLNRFFTKWRIKINPTKTEAIFFTKRRKPQYKPSEPVKLNGSDVSWKDSVRYLGVHIDKRLTFKSHVDKTIEKNELLIKVLYPLIGRSSRLLMKNKMLLFKQIFRPTLSFAAPVISQCAATHRKRLQIAQNKVLKIIMNVPVRTATEEVHDHCGVEYFDQFIQRLTDSFITRSRRNPNPEVEQLYND